MRKKFYAFAIALGLVVGFFAATPANAADNDSVCESGEICIYYTANLTNAAWTNNDFSISNFSGKTFSCCGAGTGASVNDNTWSGRNRGGTLDVDLCTNSFWWGSCIVLDPGEIMNDFNEYRDTFSSYTF